MYLISSFLVLKTLCKYKRVDLFTRYMRVVVRLLAHWHNLIHILYNKLIYVILYIFGIFIIRLHNTYIKISLCYTQLYITWNGWMTKGSQKLPKWRWRNIWMPLSYKCKWKPLEKDEFKGQFRCSFCLAYFPTWLHCTSRFIVNHFKLV